MKSGKRQEVIIPSLVLLSFLIFLVIVMYLFKSLHYLDVYVKAACLAAFCISIHLQGIGTGRNNFGPQLYWGIGGFVAGIFSKFFGFSPFLTFFAVIGIALIISSIMSFLTVFSGGLYYTLLTLVLPYILLQVSFSYSGIFGGEEGLSGIPRLVQTGRASLNALCAAIIATLFIIVYLLVTLLLLRSKYSLGLKAISQNEDVARQLGVNVTKYKIVTFIATSVMSSIIGWFTAHYYGMFLGTAYLPLTFLTKVIICLVLGAGPFGIVFASLAIEYLEEIQRIMLGEIHHFIYPLSLLIIFVIVPRGLDGYLKHTVQRYGSEENEETYRRKEFCL